MAGEPTWGSRRGNHLGAELLLKTATDSTWAERARPSAGTSWVLRATLEKRWVAGL